MNWITVFNKKEKEMQNIIYEKCCYIQDKAQEELDYIYDEFTNKFNLDNLQKNQDLNVKIINEIINERKIKCNKNFDLIYEDFYNTIIKLTKELASEVGKYIKSNRDETLFLKRFSIWKEKVFSQHEYFLKETVFDMFENIEYYIKITLEAYIDMKFEIFEKNIYDVKQGEFLSAIKPIIDINDENDLRLLRKIAKETDTEDFLDELLNFDDNDKDNLTKENIVSTNIFIKDDKTKKIFCRKEMEKLAEDNGYVYKWSNGSHRIYEHKTTNKIIVIPSHDLGKGLSKKIQKQIFSNSKCNKVS